MVHNFAEGIFLKFCTNFETSLADCAAICKAVFAFCLNCFSSSKLILQIISSRPTKVDVVYNFAEESFIKFGTDFEMSLADCAAICKVIFCVLFDLFLFDWNGF